MDKTGRICIFGPGGNRRKSRSAARFVAHRPTDDRRMVPVAYDHARDAFQKRRDPVGIVGQQSPHAVRLDVRLVDDVQAVGIAEIIEIGIVGIVARAHGVEVILLHQADVGLDVGPGDRFARAGVVVVAVDAVEFHRNAVNKEFFAADLDFAKTHTDAPGLDDRALRVAERQHERIEVRRFGREDFASFREGFLTWITTFLV